MSFASPWALWLLPLALLPLFAPPGKLLPHSWLALLPRDAASDALHWVLRGTASLALAALVCGLAGPYQPEYAVKRLGKGAEIVLLLDRSRSMDQGFAGGTDRSRAPSGTGPEALDYYMRLQQSRGRESKGKVARQMLAEFVAKRPNDRFSMVVFSSLPMRVLEFTHKPEVIQAAIAAGNIGRGLSETDIGLALQAALSLFEDRPYTGSRLIMLVSDGGDHIDPDARERIVYLARRHRVSVNWIYIRSTNSPRLAQSAASAPGTNAASTSGSPSASGSSASDAVPEIFLHRFLQTLGTPYRAYEAENVQALQEAIDDVNRLQNLPITYYDTVPQRDVSQYFYGAALACVVLLLAANLMEIRRWH